MPWYRKNKRDLPWRNTKNPYKIWISEIILQQTRVEQGLNYYYRFIEHFPAITDLAQASTDQVLKLWQGLGYYSRARNLHTTARHICKELNGQFPASYTEIHKLKGVGSYTAAAIASFCYNEPYAVVDGNVYRVLSRIFGISSPIDTTSGKKEFALLAQNLMNIKAPATHNQAIMEFGAIQCLPRNPNCETCPFQGHCFAFRNQKISTFPVKEKKTKSSNLYFEYLVLLYKNQTYIHKRTEKNIWQGLYEFPLIEQQRAINEAAFMKQLKQLPWLASSHPLHLTSVSPPVKHVLSHRSIYARFWLFNLKTKIKTTNYELVPQDELQNYAWPRLIDRYLETAPWLQTD